MRIAVNTRFLLKDKMTGLGHFTYELLKKMVIQHPDDEFIFLFDRPYDQDFIFAPNITPVVINPPARAPLLFYLWFEWSLPSAIKKSKADVFLSPDNFMSLSLKIPTVLIIHDLAFEHYPKDLSFFNRWYYRHFMPLFAAKADKIATVSEATKQDIIHQYGIEPSKIDVVELGLNEGFELNRQPPIREDYFVHVGTIQPRKNILRLLRAFEDYKIEIGSETKLVFIGGKGWRDNEIYTYLAGMKYKKDVIFEGYLSNERISEKLNRAIALLCVSYFEGFGMPVIEAQASGCPVICSNVSSLPEAAGDGALFIDPFDTASITDAMIRINNDKEFRDDLIRQGLLNAKKFTWTSTANKVWQCILSVRK